MYFQFYLQNLQNNPNYATMFRSKPVRMVLPLSVKIGINKSNKQENLINIQNTKAEAYRLPNGNILLKSEPLTNLGCETPRINYEKHLGNKTFFTNFIRSKYPQFDRP